MYFTESISLPHRLVTSTLCRMFNKPVSTKFSLEWLPLIDAVVNATIMN